MKTSTSKLWLLAGRDDSAGTSTSKPWLLAGLAGRKETSTSKLGLPAGPKGFTVLYVFIWNSGEGIPSEEPPAQSRIGGVLEACPSPSGPGRAPFQRKKKNEK